MYFLCAKFVRSKVSSGDLIADRHLAKTRTKACWTPLHPHSASKCLVPVLSTSGYFNSFQKDINPLVWPWNRPSNFTYGVSNTTLPTHGCGFPALPRIRRCHTHENKSSIKPTIFRSDLHSYTGCEIDDLQSCRPL